MFINCGAARQGKVQCESGNSKKAKGKRHLQLRANRFCTNFNSHTEMHKVVQMKMKNPK